MFIKIQILYYKISIQKRIHSQTKLCAHKEIFLAAGFLILFKGELKEICPDPFENTVDQRSFIFRNLLAN